MHAADFSSVPHCPQLPPGCPPATRSPAGNAARSLLAGSPPSAELTGDCRYFNCPGSLFDFPQMAFIDGEAAAGAAAPPPLLPRVGILSPKSTATPFDPFIGRAGKFAIARMRNKIHSLDAPLGYSSLPPFRHGSASAMSTKDPRGGNRRTDGRTVI